MKRSRIDVDPAKVRAWQDRSRAKALARSRETRRKPLASRSQKRIDEAPEREAVLAAVVERDGGGCFAHDLVPALRCGSPWHDRPTLEGHEVIPRSVWPGGHLVAENVRMVCQNHHDWIGDEPDLAHDVGLHGYSWERPA